MALKAVKLCIFDLVELADYPHTGGVDLHDSQVRYDLIQGEAFAMMDGGECFGAAGVMPMWEGAGHGWAIFRVPTGCARLKWATREVRRFLDASPLRRIQTTIATDFAHGLVWARLLTFAPEGILQCYVNGCDHMMLARIR